jgi:hypothetical protein
MLMQMQVLNASLTLRVLHLVFMFSRTLSLKASFLEIFSLTLACSKIKSLKDGCLGLEEL